MHLMISDWCSAFALNFPWHPFSPELAGWLVKAAKAIYLLLVPTFMLSMLLMYACMHIFSVYVRFSLVHWNVHRLTCDMYSLLSLVFYYRYNTLFLSYALLSFTLAPQCPTFHYTTKIHCSLYKDFIWITPVYVTISILPCHVPYNLNISLLCCSQHGPKQWWWCH